MVDLLRGVMLHDLKKGSGEEGRKGLARHLYLELEPWDFKRCQVSRSPPDEKRNGGGGLIAVWRWKSWGGGARLRPELSGSGSAASGT